jgi:hypothetical protein
MTCVGAPADRHAEAGNKSSGHQTALSASPSSWPTRIQLETRSSTAHYSAMAGAVAWGLHGGAEDADRIHEGEVQPA